MNLGDEPRTLVLADTGAPANYANIIQFNKLNSEVIKKLLKYI